MANDQTSTDNDDAVEQETAPDPPLIDGVTINRIMTAYLHGLHMLKRGHLSAPDAMDHVLGGLKTMEEMRAKGRAIWDQFCPQYLKKD